MASSLAFWKIFRTVFDTSSLLGAGWKLGIIGTRLAQGFSGHRSGVPGSSPSMITKAARNAWTAGTGWTAGLRPTGYGLKG